MYPYLTLDPGNSRVEITSVQIQYPALVLHIILAFIALLTGFLQFVNRIRREIPRFHRYIGRVYVVSVFTSGLLAFVVTYYAEDFTKALAFFVLAVLWILTTWKAYRKAVNRNFSEHRIWMIRSFGITLVAVSARMLVPVLLLGYAAFHHYSLPGRRMQMVEEVLKVNIWVGIALNIAIVEWVILSRR
ncbi:MAG TPA: DUF2306 domain-containing protein [Bacillales bacterium]|nr:DUF2306 domain-containing protein [Bacillales bacterium]